MTPHIDQYTGISSPLHRWDPRLKLVGLLVLIFAFSYIRDLRMLAAMVAVTAAIYLTSRLPVRFLLSRLRYPSLFLIVVIATLPFVSGQTVIWSLGPLDLRQEGLLATLLIAVRFLAILTVGLVLFGTAPLLTTIKALRALRLPSILTDMTLLFFRYLYEFGNSLRKMQTSMHLRGFKGRRLSPHSLRFLAWLSGSILVRSYERSEWVYKAMTLRGYGYAPHPESQFQARFGDAVALGTVLLVAAAFIAGDILLGHGASALLQ